MQVPHTYTAPAPHSLSIPIVNKGDLLSEVALGAFMVCSAHLSAVTAEWSEGNWAPCWPWACVWAHLGHGAIPFCRAWCSPVMPQAGSARAVGSKHRGASWSEQCCTSKWEISLGRVIPWAKTLLSGQYLVPLWGLWWTSATLTGRVLEAASLVVGDSALSKTEKPILHFSW